MNRFIRKLKKSSRVLRYIYYVICIVYIISLFFFIKSLLSLTGIETILRIVFIVFFILYIVIYAFWNLLNLLRRKYKALIATSVVSIIFIAIFCIGSYYINIVYNNIDSITENDRLVYTTYLIALKDTDFDNDSSIGMLDDESEIEWNVLAKTLYSEEKLVNSITDYSDYNSMLRDLYDGDIDAIFVPGGYVTLFSNEEQYANIASETKILYKYSEEMENQDLILSSNKDFNEPLTFLLMGVDSETSGLNANAAFNGDTLMLITFNPHTMNATVLSIPRDTRVPIACTRSKAKNKINSAALYGADCVMDTITNFTGIEIDYWVKVNFQGVISLVDALGGIDVDVPYAFCESNSQRKFGKNTIYVEKGYQTLNGEQALAFARNRHTWPQYCGRKYSNYTSNDFVRGQNQQQIVKAIVNKLKDIRSLSEIYDILDILGDNVDTNIDRETMITGFDTFKNIIFNSKNITSDDFIGTQRLYLSGYDNTISGIYYFEYYKQSLKEITDAMEINLELEEPEMDKEFSFSINNPYEDTQIGKGTYSY